jgi:hypothetical protein
MSVVDAFSEKAARRANGTVKEPLIATYPETDRFPSSAQRQSWLSIRSNGTASICRSVLTH